MFALTADQELFEKTTARYLESKYPSDHVRDLARMPSAFNPKHGSKERPSGGPRCWSQRPPGAGPSAEMACSTYSPWHINSVATLRPGHYLPPTSWPRH